MSVVAKVALVLLASAHFGEAASFLAAERTWASKSVAVASVEELLRSERPGSAKGARLRALQEELEPMYVALPKNEHGFLEHNTVRYALHRHFAHRYGWYVRGLTGDGDSWKANTSAEILKDRVPFHIQSVLERQAHGRGLDLRDLATFATTLTDLIEEDAYGYFQECYDSLELPRDGDIDEADVGEVLRGYLARYIFNAEQELYDSDTLHHIEEKIQTMYSGWPAAVMWLEDARRTVEWSHQSRRNPFVAKKYTFPHVVDVLQSIMQRFSEVANADCSEIKTRLMSFEHLGTGRVRLMDFYSNMPKLGTRAESKAYLRNLGVLDETDPERPLLLIANFVTSPANCLVDGSYYSSCCLNECEGLFGRLEHALYAPMASPNQIVDVVAHLPSDTVNAPRNLSSTLLSRLNDIAQRHGGRVPLHGRLFAQWMHHAYPRECPFPQLANGVRPLSQEEFFTLHDLEDVFATDEEMAEHTSEKHYNLWRHKVAHISAEDLPWNDVEELLISTRPATLAGSQQWLRLVMALVALGSMVATVTRTLSAGACVGSTDKTLCV